MKNIITLSSGHCWVKGAITFVSPITPADLEPDTESPFDSFYIKGPGIKINFYSKDLWEGINKPNIKKREAFALLHKEVIAKVFEE